MKFSTVSSLAVLMAAALAASCSVAPAPFEPAAALHRTIVLEWNDGVEGELPTRRIPNIPFAAEAYYGPDSFHIIAQTQDPIAGRTPRGLGSLTYTFTDEGTDVRRINDRGQDACSFFFPDGKRLIWTSTRDRTDLPTGDWSNEKDYPRGAEIYISDLTGKNVRRITNNEYYDAEVSIAPDGKTILFARQIDGRVDLWTANSEGGDQHQITFTNEWQEGGAFFLPDSDRILLRAWKKSEFGQVRPTPMTLFTIRKDGTDLRRHTSGDGMHWAPFPAPDGRHYVYVRALDAQNWAIYLGDFAGGVPRRLTFAPGFNGFPSISPDGTKLLFARFAVDKDGQRGLATFVQDVSSLNIGPRSRQAFGADWGAKVVGDPDQLDRRQPVQRASAGR